MTEGHRTMLSRVRLVRRCLRYGNTRSNQTRHCLDSTNIPLDQIGRRGRGFRTMDLTNLALLQREFFNRVESSDGH
jgi:hypothetical protein